MHSPTEWAFKHPVQSHRVETEGDELFVEVRGQGQPILMIAPAGGDGWQYAKVADILADDFKVITYDRRANARSTMNNPQNFEVSQQSRDAVAVLRSAGETTAFVFGNSSGAVFALDMAKPQPQAVRLVVVHEPPIPRMLPNSRKWQRFFAKVYVTAFRLGSSWAAVRFMMGAKLPVRGLIKATEASNLHMKQSKEPYLGAKDAAEVLTKLELLPVTNYLPDVRRIREGSVKVVVAVGQWGLSRNAWYTQAARILAQKLSCSLVTFPGHHGSFMDMPEEFARALLEVFRGAQTSA